MEQHTGCYSAVVKYFENNEVTEQDKLCAWEMEDLLNNFVRSRKGLVVKKIKAFQKRKAKKAGKSGWLDLSIELSVSHGALDKPNVIGTFLDLESIQDFAAQQQQCNVKSSRKS